MKDRVLGVSNITVIIKSKEMHYFSNLFGKEKAFFTKINLRNIAFRGV